MLIFDSQKLDELAERYRSAYDAADPFPHIVLDEFLDGDVLRQVSDSFPVAGEAVWSQIDTWRSKKLHTENELLLADSARSVLQQLNSSTFVNFLERLTGIEGLIPDPHFTGGGLHQIEPGGFLKIHADFNRHPRLKLDRRLNLLLYLNEDWKEEYGGHLELWDRGMARCAQRILPLFNRCVIFSTTDSSFHGHPEPLKCPPGWTRKSLALYYYTNGRPAGESDGEHGTLTRLRPGERAGSVEVRGAALRAALRLLLPPIVFDARRLLSRRNGRGPDRV